MIIKGVPGTPHPLRLVQRPPATGTALSGAPAEAGQTLLAVDWVAGCTPAHSRGVQPGLEPRGRQFSGRGKGATKDKPTAQPFLLQPQPRKEWSSCETEPHSANPDAMLRGPRSSVQALVQQPVWFQHADPRGGALISRFNRCLSTFSKRDP